MSRRFTHSRQGGSPATADLARVEAYQRLFNGNGNKDDADIVLTDLATFAGLHVRPVFANSKKGAQEFLLQSALANARVEPIDHILEMLAFSDDQRVALLQTARLESARLQEDMRAAG